MFIRTSLATIAGLSIAPVLVQAQSIPDERPIIFGGALSFGHTNRNGADLNASGPPLEEVPSFATTDLSGFVAFPVGNSFLFQIDGEFENAATPDFVTACCDLANDTYSDSRFVSAQFGMTSENYYVGAFGGLGRVNFTLWDWDQDTDYRIWGLSGAYFLENWIFSGQVGILDSNTLDPESLEKARFLQVSAEHFFNGGNTSLEGVFSFAVGEQDTDSSSAPDPVEVRAFGVVLEHVLPTAAAPYQTSVFARLDRIDVNETSSSGSTDRVGETNVMLGMRIVFGAQSLNHRARNTAPELPQFSRWLAAVPAVD